MRYLITGGPVHAHLDDVKIITNTFKGGLMAELAMSLVTLEDSVTYLVPKGTKIDLAKYVGVFEIIYHNGYHDYRRILKEISNRYDAVVLGAAVVNLIPKEPFVGKFPSHNYKVGDVINIPFELAPRVINEVKETMKVGSHLFGFKLLSNVSYDELISSAYDVLLDSKATAVFANDKRDLNEVYVVTKERAVNKISRSEIKDWIKAFTSDKYYKSNSLDNTVEIGYRVEYGKHSFDVLYDLYKEHFVKSQRGYVFGSISVRSQDGFITTCRGKQEMNGDLVYVKNVDHDSLNVNYFGKVKPSLNTPLIDSIFKLDSSIYCVVHYHEKIEGCISFPYAPPGTKRDSDRDLQKIDIEEFFEKPVCFNVEGHGCYIILTNKAMRIIA